MTICFAVAVTFSRAFDVYGLQHGGTISDPTTAMEAVELAVTWPRTDPGHAGCRHCRPPRPKPSLAGAARRGHAAIGRTAAECLYDRRADTGDEYRTDVSLERLPTQVLRENFYVTISGNYHTPSLMGVLSELEPDRVAFAVDHLFEQAPDGGEWFDSVALDEADRATSNGSTCRR